MKDIKEIRQVGDGYIRVGECPECMGNVLKFISSQPQGQTIGLVREKYRCSECDLQGDAMLWKSFWDYKWMYKDLCK